MERSGIQKWKSFVSYVLCGRTASLLVDDTTSKVKDENDGAMDRVHCCIEILWDHELRMFLGDAQNLACSLSSHTL